MISHAIIVCSQSNVLYQKEFKSDYIIAKYSKPQIYADIDFMLSVIKKSHPNYYHSFTEIHLRKTIDSVLLSLQDSSDIYQASLAISIIASQFNEGHLGLLTNKEIYNHFTSYDKKFPFSLIGMSDSALIIQQDLSTNPVLEVADSIISINDIPISFLINRFIEYFGGLAEWRKSMTKIQFDYLLYASKIFSPYKIIAKHSGAKIEFVAEGVSKIQQNNGNNNRKKNKNYKYSILENDIAYINFNSMIGDTKVFKDSLKLTFKDINERNLKKLIVDIRHNGGGNSHMGEIFLSFVNDKPYRLTAGGELKISKPVKQYFRRTIPWYYKGFLYLVPSGITINYSYKPHKPTKNESFYNGKYCVLIGTNTFSSANLFANAIQDYSLATLIGENTAEPCNDYGDMIAFMLPNTQLIARTSFQKFIRANGDKKDTNSVIPNYKIVPSFTDMKNRKDIVLDFAKEWIRENN